MRPFIKLSAVPGAGSTRIHLEVWDGDAKGQPARLYHRLVTVPIVPPEDSANVHMHAMRTLMAMIYSIAAAKYPYPRDAVLELVDQEHGITIGVRWDVDTPAGPIGPAEPRGPRGEQ